MRIRNLRRLPEAIMKKALICGISGQDGAYLAKLLLSKGYQVWGTSRDANMVGFENLQRLGVKHQVHLLSLAQSDFRSMLNTLSRSDPDEIYFLSGQSSVALSFDQPAESINSITYGALNLLEAVRFFAKPVRIYHASSSECFGNLIPGKPANELTPFNPRSPYAVAKASAHWLFTNYREAYGINCCNGILFNHESPLRPAKFVTRKIVSTAYRISQGSSERLLLGRLDIARDWGWSPDFVEAMWLMLQQDHADDYVIATGETHSLEEFVSGIFSLLDLDWQRYVDQDANLFRPLEIHYSAGNPTKAQDQLKWRATVSFSNLLSKLLQAEREFSEKVMI